MVIALTLHSSSLGQKRDLIRLLNPSSFFPDLLLSILEMLICFVRINAVVKDLKYADSHEWVKVEGNSATIGITDHAQDHLGDVVYVELPEEGAEVTQGAGFGAVESVKATSDINSPISGKVVEVNTKLNDSPGLVSICFYAINLSKAIARIWKSELELIKSRKLKKKKKIKIKEAL